MSQQRKGIMLVYSNSELFSKSCSLQDDCILFVSNTQRSSKALQQELLHPISVQSILGMASLESREVM